MNNLSCDVQESRVSNTFLLAVEFRSCDLSANPAPADNIQEQTGECNTEGKGVSFVERVHSIWLQGC